MNSELEPKEVPINVNIMQAGETVIVANYARNPTQYSYARVTAISKQKQIITLGGSTALRYEKTGYKYTSLDSERYTERLLQVTDEMKAYMHRQSLLRYFHNIVWELQSTIVLETTYHAFTAGMAIDVDEGF